MKNATAPVGVILCLLLSTLPGQSLSQTQESPPPDNAQRLQQFQQEQRQGAEERRQRIIQQQEEFWRRVDEQERQRLQEAWPHLTEDERQRRQESLRRSEEQHRQYIQGRRESSQRMGEQVKQDQQRMEQWMKETARIRGAYEDQAWQEALGATAEQWKVIKPRLEKVRTGVSVSFIRMSIYSYAGRANFSTKASSHIFGAHDPNEGGRGQSSSGGDAPGVATGGSQTAGTGGASDTSSAHSHAFATSGFGFSGDVLSKPVKKQVGDVCLGWDWNRFSRHTSFDKLPEGLRACEQLLDVLEMRDPDSEQVRQRVETVRQIREQQQAEYRRAREELRKVVTPEQEARLILMGYLD